MPSSSDDNKTKIAKSGALVPLTRLARSKDMRVQRNATGALLNMTHSGELVLCSFRLFTELSLPDENRQQLVNAGAIPVLVSLLNSPDTDVQYYCTTALSNIAVDGTCHVVNYDWPRLCLRSREPQEAGPERTEASDELGATDG